MGNTCKSMADSCQCMAKTTKKKEKEKRKKKLLHIKKGVYLKNVFTFLKFYNVYEYIIYSKYK